jgi:hypothetical protein
MEGYNMDNIQNTLIRSDFFNKYLQSIIQYLHIQYPEYSKEQIQSVLKEILKDYDPKTNITYVYHSSPGNSVIKTSPLKEFLKLTDNCIITPSGSFYRTLHNHSSFFVDLIKTNTKDRSIAKKKKLEAKAKGNKLEADYWENQQQQKKYDNNGFSGLLRSPYVGFYDLAGYNSTTSLARKSIYISYTHTERFIAGNFYLPTFESIVNHCLLIKSITKPLPDNLSLKIYIPNKEDVLEFILSIYKQYYHIKSVIQSHIFKFKKLLNSFNQDELIYLFYYENLNQLIQYNSEYFKSYFQDLLNPVSLQEHDYLNQSVVDISTLDDDLKILISVIFSDVAQGNFLFKDNQLVVEDLKMYSTIINTIKHLQIKLEQELLPLIMFFNDTSIEIPDIQSQKKMIRKTVIISDTDSVLYTKDPYIKWYTGNSIVSKDSMNISALLDYLLTKSIKPHLKIHCLNHGVDLKDIDLINMKNEYTYTVFIAANKPKTYIGSLLIQEGRVFKTLELDIKGSIYKGSIYSNRTLQEYQIFLTELLQEISSCGSISAIEYIKKLVQRETNIIQSLQKGETFYLTPKSIRMLQDYKFPNSSILFNCNIYNKILGDKYGVLTPPLKTITVDINSKLFKSQEYQDYLYAQDQNIYDRYMHILKEIDLKKAVTFLPINPVTETIPIELIPIINYVSITHKNCKPWYELYQSLGITIPPVNTDFLFKDIYT